MIFYVFFANLFFSSLITYHTWWLSVAFILINGLILAVYNQIRLSRHALVLVMFLLVWSFVTDLSGQDLSSNSIRDLLSYVHSTSVIILFLAVLDTNDGFIRVDAFLKSILAVHVLFLLLQGIQYYVFRDTNGWHPLHLLGQSPKTSGTAGIVGIHRLTGLLSEPGTYSNLIIALVSLRLILVKQMDRTNLLSLASIFATLSLRGIFLAIGLLFLSFYWRSFKAICFFVLFMMLLGGITGFFELAISYLENRVSGSDGTTTTLNSTLFSYFSESDGFDLVIGNGLFSDVPELLKIQDVGVLFNFIYRLGFLGALILGASAIFAKINYGWFGLGLFSLLLLNKADIWHAYMLILISIFWIPPHFYRLGRREMFLR